jgi:hypothetical protein
MTAADASDLQVLGNTSTATFDIDRARGLTLAGNEVSAVNGAGDRTSAVELADSQDVLIADNVLAGSHIGVAFLASGGPPSQSAELIGNTIVGNVYGIAMHGATPAFAGPMEVHSNRIAGNEHPLWSDTPDPVGLEPPVFGAEDNWWGCNTGVDSPGCGFAVGEPGDTEPHLVLGLAAPAAISPAGAATLTADLTRNSDGTTIVGDRLPPAPVSFAVTAGSVLPSQESLQGGVASTRFEAPAKDQVVSASARLDAETAAADVVVGTGVTPDEPPAVAPATTPAAAAGASPPQSRPRPVIGLRARGRRLRARGTVSVSLRCRPAAGPCRGRLELRRAGRRTLLGRAAFEVPPNAERTVPVRLGRRARRLLRRMGQLRVVARTTGASSGGVALSASTRFTLRRR